MALHSSGSHCGLGTTPLPPPPGSPTVLESVPDSTVVGETGDLTPHHEIGVGPVLTVVGPVVGQRL